MVQETPKPRCNVGAFYGGDFDNRLIIESSQNLEAQKFLNRTAI